MERGFSLLDNDLKQLEKDNDILHCNRSHGEVVLAAVFIKDVFSLTVFCSHIGLLLLKCVAPLYKSVVTYCTH